MQKLTSCSMCSAGGRTATTSFAPSCTPSTFAIRSQLNPQLRFPWRQMCRFPNAARHCALRRLTVPPQKQMEHALQSALASHRKPGSGVPPQMRRPCFPACRRFTARFRKRSFSPSQRAPVRTFRSALQAAQHLIGFFCMTGRKISEDHHFIPFSYFFIPLPNDIFIHFMRRGKSPAVKAVIQIFMKKMQIGYIIPHNSALLPVPAHLSKLYPIRCHFTTRTWKKGDGPAVSYHHSRTISSNRRTFWRKSSIIFIHYILNMFF